MLREVVVLLLRGCRLRCPCCGYGRLFKSATRMHEHCSACGEAFEREPGQWLGAVYINLGLTLAVVAAGYMLTNAFTSLTSSQVTVIWMVGAAIGPFALHRHAKALWTSIVFLGEGLYIPWPPR